MHLIRSIIQTALHPVATPRRRMAVLALCVLLALLFPSPRVVAAATIVVAVTGIIQIATVSRPSAARPAKSAGHTNPAVEGTAADMQVELPASKLHPVLPQNAPQPCPAIERPDDSNQ
jgi:hypothetical protein